MEFPEFCNLWRDLLVVGGMHRVAIGQVDDFVIYKSQKRNL